MLPLICLLECLVALLLKMLLLDELLGLLQHIGRLLSKHIGLLGWLGGTLP